MAGKPGGPGKSRQNPEVGPGQGFLGLSTRMEPMETGQDRQCPAGEVGPCLKPPSAGVEGKPDKTDRPNFRKKLNFSA